MRIPAGQLREIFLRLLLQRGVAPRIAQCSAENFVESSLDGVYSHGVNRFPRVIQYLDKRIIAKEAEPVCVAAHGALQQWDGNLGMGNANAALAMDRACELAQLYGAGVVAMRNTNHWMRGGAYGWQAARKNCIGICWTNTMPNTPAWGGKEPRIGNNPFVLSIPQGEGKHIVIDCAMSQFAYGKIEMAKMKGEQLPVPGGWDSAGRVTTDPAAILQTGRVLTIGYWKGSGLSIALDLIAAILSSGNTVTDIGEKYADETGLSQVFIALSPAALSAQGHADGVIQRVVDAVKSASPVSPDGRIYYPGEMEYLTRIDHLKNGIPVLDEVWEEIQAL